MFVYLPSRLRQNAKNVANKQTKGRKESRESE